MNKLEKLEEQYNKLGEEIEALKKEDAFVPGWYMYWDSPKCYRVIRFIKDEASLDEKKDTWDHIEPVTQELLNQFLPKPKTRYDWKAILEKYPNARYVTTDENGRVDVWETKPTTSLRTWFGHYKNPITQGTRGYDRVGDTPDWKRSLEEKPFDI